MSRAFWFAAGAASGVYALVKAKRTAENFTPDGVATRLAAWREGARLFTAEVSSGMAHREASIREELARDRLALPAPVPRAAQGSAAARPAAAVAAAGAVEIETPRPHQP